jgi:outer membrane protein assembly factor BamB
MHGRTLTVLAALVTFASTAALAADWPQWRGKFRDGISPETGLLAEWPAEGPPLVWHAKDVGDGYSTPAVVGDRIYLISNQGTDDEYVQALSTSDAKQLWRTKIGKVGPNQGPQYPGSRSTTTVDGDLLYALGSNGDLACLEAESGKLRWTKNLRSDFGGQPGKWAYSESPLVDGDKVVVTPGGAEATIVALNKNTGEAIWKSASPEADEAGYASIIVVNVGSAKQYVQFLAKGLVGVDPESGKQLWRYDRTAQGSPANIPTPVAADEFIYSAASRSGGGLVKLKFDGDAIAAEQVYFEPKMPSGIGGSVLVDGYLYGTNSQGLMCIKFDTGEVKWQDRSVGAASVLAAEGRLYVNGDTGDVALVEITPEAYREKSRFTLPEQPDRGRSKAWAYPVIADGKLYLRDLGSLWCYDVTKK